MTTECRQWLVFSAERPREEATTMKADGYSSDELKSFHRVLQAALSDANARPAEFPVADMIARLFEAADNGERDPAKLRAAVLAAAQSRASATSKQTKSRGHAPIAIASKRRAHRPILTQFPLARLSKQKI